MNSRNLFSKLFQNTVENLMGYFWKFEIEGLEYLSPEHNYIFCPNHESMLDNFMVSKALTKNTKINLYTIATNQLNRKRIYRWVIKTIQNVICINPGAFALRSGLRVLHSGSSLMIFPEGIRTRDGKLGVFHKGPAKLSILSGVPLVPVAIIGAYEVYPHSIKFPRLYDCKNFRRYKIKVFFGQPLQCKNEEVLFNYVVDFIVGKKAERRERPNANLQQGQL